MPTILVNQVNIVKRGQTQERMRQMKWEKIQNPATEKNVREKSPKFLSQKFHPFSSFLALLHPNTVICVLNPSWRGPRGMCSREGRAGLNHYTQFFQNVFRESTEPGSGQVCTLVTNDLETLGHQTGCRTGGGG